MEAIYECPKCRCRAQAPVINGSTHQSYCYGHPIPILMRPLPDRKTPKARGENAANHKEP